MRCLLSLCVALSLAATAGAADEPKPNTLTPDQIKEGWILLWDGETTFGWHSPNESKWSIVDGMLAPQAEKPGLLVTTAPFKDYELVFEFQRKKGATGTLDVDCDYKGQPQNSDAERRKVELLDYDAVTWTRAGIYVQGGFINQQIYQPSNSTVAIA